MIICRMIYIYICIYIYLGLLKHIQVFWPIQVKCFVTSVQCEFRPFAATAPKNR